MPDSFLQLLFTVWLLSTRGKKHNWLFSVILWDSFEPDISAESSFMPVSGLFTQQIPFLGFSPCAPEFRRTSYRHPALCNKCRVLFFKVFTRRRRWNVQTPETGRWRGCWENSCRDREPRPTEPCGSFLMTTCLSCQRSSTNYFSATLAIQSYTVRRNDV